MATLDDKLLGEKLQNYCSSSSEDEEEKDDNEGGSRGTATETKAPKFIPETEVEKWSGNSQNTGPKGVIKDWQRYKQLENQKSADSERERKELIKKLSLTCRIEPEKEADIKNETKASEEQFNEDELLDDPFFKQYLQQRLDEMKQRIMSLPKFGKVIELTNETYLNEIDNENKEVTILIHIYDPKINECKILNEVLQSLAQDYPIVKFCRVRSNEISLTERFRKLGCPALLAYKSGELIGNFVRLNDEFGDEFYTSDVEGFLIEHGILPTSDVSGIRSSEAKKIVNTT